MYLIVFDICVKSTLRGPSVFWIYSICKDIIY